MGIAILDKNADNSSKASFIIPPVAEGLLGWGYLGGTLEKSLRNRARNQPALNVVGAPVVSENYVTFNGTTNYFQSSIFQRGTHTIFCIARSSDTFDPEAHQPMLISTFNGQNTLAPAYATQGIVLYVTKSGFGAPTGKLTGLIGGFTPAAPAAAIATTVQLERSFANFALLSMTNTQNSICVKDWTNGITSTNPIPDGRVVAPSNRAFAIGSPANPITYKGSVDIAAWVIYEGALSENQAAMVAASLRSTYAAKGIAV